MFLRFAKSENGATAIEYGLIAAVLSLAIVGGVGNASDSLKWLFSDNASKLAQAFKDGGGGGGGGD